MEIIILLSIVVLTGGAVVGAIFFSIIFTASIWLLYTGIDFVTTPALPCANGCFKPVFYSEANGWFMIVTAVTLIILLAVHILTKTTIFNKKNSKL